MLIHYELRLEGIAWDCGDSNGYCLTSKCCQDSNQKDVLAPRMVMHFLAREAPTMICKNMLIDHRFALLMNQRIVDDSKCFRIVDDPIGTSEWDQVWGSRVNSFAASGQRGTAEIAFLPADSNRKHCPLHYPSSISMSTNDHGS